MNPKLVNLVETLKKDGQTDEAISSVIQGITSIASTRLFGEMTANFTEADWSELDKCADQEEANIKTRILFARYSDKSPESILDEMITSFIDGFLLRFNEDKAAAMAAPVEPQPANTPT